MLTLNEANVVFSGYWGTGNSYCAYDEPVREQQFTSRRQFAEWVASLYLEYPYNLIDDAEPGEVSLGELADVAMGSEELDYLIAIQGLATGYDLETGAVFGVDTIADLPRHCQVFAMDGVGGTNVLVCHFED